MVLIKTKVVLKKVKTRKNEKIEKDEEMYDRGMQWKKEWRLKVINESKKKKEEEMDEYWRKIKERKKL